MVCEEAKAPVVSKRMVLGAAGLLAGLALVLTLAQPTVARRLPTEPSSAVLVTRYDEDAS